MFWQRNQDLNPDEQSQSLLCYRYTIPLCEPISFTAINILSQMKMFVNTFFGKKSNYDKNSSQSKIIHHYYMHNYRFYSGYICPSCYATLTSAFRRKFTHNVNFTITDNFTCPKGKLSISVMLGQEHHANQLYISSGPATAIPCFSRAF